MKTVTEFFGKSLKTLEEQLPAFTSELTKSIVETMKTEGKSEEEIAAGLPVVLKTQLDAKISETQKVEGDKLTMLMGALSAIKGRRGNLKRVIVMVPMVEGEKAPSGAIENEGKFFVCEYFPEPTRAHKGSRDEGKFEGRGGRDGKRGGKGGRGGKDGGRGGRGRDDRGAGGGRGPGGPGGDRPRGPRRPEGAPLEAGAVVIGSGAPGGESGQRRNPRPPRAPRPPREPRAPRAPREGERVRAPGEKWTIIPRSEMPVAAAPAMTEAASNTESQSSS